MIGYLKIYFKYYTKIIYAHENKTEYFDFNSIKEKLKLNLNELEPMKLLKIYIFELLYEQCNKDNNTLISFIKDFSVDYLSSYIENISDTNKCKKDAKTNYFMFSYEILDIKLNLFKERIDKNKNPLLYNLFQNEDKINMLDKLPSINKLTNLIRESLYYKKTNDEIDSSYLNDEKEIIEIKDFKKLKEDYISNYNSLISDNSQILSNDINYPLGKFIIEKNKLLYTIYKDFINSQNNFIESLIKGNISDEIKEFLKNIDIIYVQDARESDILEENKILEFISQNSFIKYKFDESNNDILFDETFKNTYFNFDKIEKLIIFEILKGVKKFYPIDNGIKKVVKREEYKEIDKGIISDYQKKFGIDNISDENIQKINNNLNNLIKEDNYNLLLPNLLLSLQYLMIHIYSNSNNLTNDYYIEDVIRSIPPANTWIQLDLLKKLFEIKENEKGNNGAGTKPTTEVNNDFNFMDAFNDIANGTKNYKLSQLITIFNIYQNLTKN